MAVDCALDGARVAAIVRDQFPELPATTVSYLGEGCDSTAFEVDGCWVFRFPKRADVEAQLLVERRALPVLATQSPLPLPSYCFDGRPSALFPRHFGGYEKLAGEPALRLDGGAPPLETWAPVLARFLSWLHAVPVARATEMGVPNASASSLLEEVRADALDDLRQVRRVAPDAPLDRWRSYLEAAPVVATRRSPPPVLVHRDLGAEHVLADPESQRLTGVIDWSEIAIDDRWVDFAGLYHWGGRRFVEAVLAAYREGVTEDELERARYLGACRGAADVTFGLEMKRQEYIDSGLRALRRCIDADHR